MVERLLIHNYKGFVNFEMKFGRIAFLAGRNGSGKSSLIDVLGSLFSVLHDGGIDDFLARDRFRFGNHATQKFELDLRMGERVVNYSVELGYENTRPHVIRERLVADGTQLLLLEQGSLRGYDGVGGEQVRPVGARNRSAVPEILDAQLKDELRRLRLEFHRFKLIPRIVDTLAQAPADPGWSGFNFATWYEDVSNSDPKANGEYIDTLRKVIPGFRALNLGPLRAEFQSGACACPLG
jgi:hypothetical protein